MVIKAYLAVERIEAGELVVVHDGVAKKWTPSLKWSSSDVEVYNDAVSSMSAYVANKEANTRVHRIDTGVCSTCHRGPKELRPGTSSGDVNVFAAPYCAECGLNYWGNKL